MNIFANQLTAASDSKQAVPACVYLAHAQYHKLTLNRQENGCQLVGKNKYRKCDR